MFILFSVIARFNIIDKIVLMNCIWPYITKSFGSVIIEKKTLGNVNISK